MVFAETLELNTFFMSQEQQVDSTMDRRQLYLNHIVAVIAIGFTSLKKKPAVTLNDKSAKRTACGLRSELFESRHSDSLKQ